tara:strand:+ start:50 stop:610 length:561 start_codon:yes stop_codon:yes gene_type:complete
MNQGKYIILDRDGVINQDSSAYVKTPDEWVPIERSMEAISLLTKNSYKIILISNQAGISRGIIRYNEMLNIHKKLLKTCNKFGGNIFSTYYCYDHPDDNSSFRKPEPGMYLEISERLNIDLSGVFAIGDSIRDIKAALASGCKPLGVKTGNGSELSDEMPDLEIFDDLFNAAQFVIENDKQYTLNI